MPILEAEPSVYPEDLLDDYGPSHGAERSWVAVYTKPRQEKALARELMGFRVPFFLPLISKRILTRRRIRRSQIPLFSGYLFMFGSEEEQVRAVLTNRVSQLLDVPDAEGLLSDLRSIHPLLQCDAPLTIERRLRPGRRVRVCSGPFLGLEGTVESCRSGYRLVVGVQLLQRGVSLEIDHAYVEPI
jgi:transcriptional antiterminator RfaH